MILIYGGIASGKSEYAENLAVELGGKRVYLATMEIQNEYDMLRIKKHRKMRSQKEFRTIECCRDIHTVKIAADEIVLLECLSSLVAAEMFRPEGRKASGEVVKKLYHDIISLDASCRELIIVGNDISQEKDSYNREVEEYISSLTLLQSSLIKAAKESREIVCGLLANRT